MKSRKVAKLISLPIPYYKFQKALLLLLFLCFSTILAAQPANDQCGTAQAFVPNGGCVNGTTTASNDTWVGSVGCQGGGGSNEVWYSFTATQSQLNFTVTSTGMGNDIEFILAESPCGDCSCSFQISGSVCGTSVLNDSITGLNIGGTYFVTISSSSTDGDFTLCMNNVAAIPSPGQDCNVGTNLCDNSNFTVGTIANGNGVISGTSSEEDVAALSCFGSAERQSQWYLFSVSQSGTIEFNINPNAGGDDFDFALFDITTSGCNLNSGGATLVACNWSGCRGSTGITSAVASEPGVVSSGMGCFGGPAAWNQTPPTVTCGNTYALLVDNFSISNSGFSFIWGGATGGMSAIIGPQADFSSSISICDVTVTNNQVCPNFTYSWTWGDGSSSSGANPGTHTYASSGTYIITETVTDPLGCSVSSSTTVTVCPLASDDINLTGIYKNSSIELEAIVPALLEPVHYEIQRSLDGENFETIERRTYQEERTFLKDKGYSPGQNFYRIIATSVNQESYLSNVVLVHTAIEFEEITIGPNPIGENLEVQFVLPMEGTVTLEVASINGQVVKEATIFGETGTNRLVVEMTELPQGVYFLRLKTPLNRAVTRFIK